MVSIVSTVNFVSLHASEVSESKEKANFWHEIVSSLYMMLMAAGNVTFSCRLIMQSRISNYSNVVPSQILTKANISYQYLPVNYILGRLMPPNPSDFPNAFFCDGIKTKQTLAKHSGQ